MSKQFLTVNSTDISGVNKKIHMIKTYSFTTDDDDGIPVTEFQTISNHDKLLSINSPSIDSVNVEDDLSEASSKVKRRKSRRTHDVAEKIQATSGKIKAIPWYKKVDWSKPILLVGFLILLYLAWTKKDVWIPRLLTSNTRIHRSIVTKEAENTDDLENSSINLIPTTPQSLSTDTTTASPNEEDDIENKNQNNDDTTVDEQTNTEKNEDSVFLPSKTGGGQRVNLRTRGTKMRFSREHKKRKHRHAKHESNDDVLEETDDTKESTRIIKSKQSASSLDSHSSKKHRRDIVTNENLKKTDLKSGIRLSTYDDITEQLRKNLQSRSRDQGFLSTVSKNTGLNKNKLYRFIYNKDYHLLTLQTFISLLDTFNLMLLIVPK